MHISYGNNLNHFLSVSMHKIKVAQAKLRKLVRVLPPHTTAEHSELSTTILFLYQRIHKIVNIYQLFTY